MEGDAKARLLAWQNPSSRICRVSRASGGKDRHSKVLTSKGLRDRRVRLSVATAIQFYDLQDRLGYDQPSKAVDWLIKAASAAIAELPTLDGAFADLSRKLEAAAAEVKQNCETDDLLPSRSKSACSSDSGNSKASVLSLSRRDKAKERHASSDGRNDDSRSSFGDLLAGGDTVGLLSKQMRNVQPTTTTATTTDYLTQGGLFAQPLKASPHAGFPIQAHFPPGAAMGILPFNLAAVSGGDNAEIQQQFAFVQDHIIPVAQVAANGDYGLNFSISPGLAGLNRGTLQSNLQVPASQLHHIQRFSSQVEGPNVPFFFGAAPTASSAPTENHFMAGLDARLQLYHGGEYCSSDLKAKEKN